MVWLLLSSSCLFLVYESCLVHMNSWSQTSKGRNTCAKSSLIRLVVSQSCLMTTSCSIRLDTLGGNIGHMLSLCIQQHWKVTILSNFSVERWSKQHTKTKYINKTQLFNRNEIKAHKGKNSLPLEQLKPEAILTPWCAIHLRSTSCTHGTHTETPRQGPPLGETGSAAESGLLQLSENKGTANSSKGSQVGAEWSIS